MTHALKSFAAGLFTASVLLIASTALADNVTLSEFQAEYPDYSNHAVMTGFATPCIDAAGTFEVAVNVTDIMSTATEPVKIVMVCQAPGYPAFNPSAGPVTFSKPGVSLDFVTQFPGHPDAFAIQYEVQPGTNTFYIWIQNTGWPEGCIDDLIDLAAWGLKSVTVESASFGAVKALF